MNRKHVADLSTWVGWVLMSGTGAFAAEPDPASVETATVEIVVSGTRTEVPVEDSVVAVEVIPRDEIEASGAQDVAELLEEQPGIQITRSSLGAGVSIQGMAPEHVLILVDGVRVLGAKDGVIDLSRFPAHQIERVEIVKGPNSALYGSDAMGGVINLITRKAAFPLSAHIDLTYGSFQSVDANGGLSLRQKEVSNQLTAGAHSTAGYDLDPSDEATTGSAKRQFEVGDQITLKLRERWTLSGGVRYLRRDLSGVDVSDSGAVFDRSNRTEDFQASAGSTWKEDRRFKLGVNTSLSVYRDQYLSDQRGSNRLDSYQETREHLSNTTVQYDRSVGSRMVLTGGVEGFVQQMQSERLFGGVGTRYRVAGYVQDDWRVLDGGAPLTVVPGVRVDVDAWFGTHTTPRLAARFDPVSWLLIRGSYGLGYRSPDFKELLLRFENPSVGYVVQGNESLQPETSQSTQVGVEIDPTRWLWLSANVYDNRIENLIDVGTIEEGGAGAPTLYGYVNVASATTRGVESGARFKLGTQTTIQLGHTYLYSRDHDRDRPLEGRSPNRYTGRITHEIESLGLRGVARAAWVDARPFYVDTNGDGEEESVAADPYVTVDLRLAKDVTQVAELSVGVDNLLNEGHVRYLAIRPRFFSVALQVQLTKSKEDADASSGESP